MFKSIALLGALLLASVEASSHKEMVTGYLIDEWCWNTNNKTALDNKERMDEVPELHTVKCSLIDFCVESGFLLLQKGPSGLYEHTHTLNAAGNKIFVELLKQESGKYQREVTLSVTEMTAKLVTVSHIAWADSTTSDCLRPVTDQAHQLVIGDGSVASAKNNFGMRSDIFVTETVRSLDDSMEMNLFFTGCPDHAYHQGAMTAPKALEGECGYKAECCATGCCTADKCDGGCCATEKCGTCGTGCCATEKCGTCGTGCCATDGCSTAWGAHEGGCYATEKCGTGCCATESCGTGGCCATEKCGTYTGCCATEKCGTCGTGCCATEKCDGGCSAGCSTSCGGCSTSCGGCSTSCGGCSTSCGGCSTGCGGCGGCGGCCGAEKVCGTKIGKYTPTHQGYSLRGVTGKMAAMKTEAKPHSIVGVAVNGVPLMGLPLALNFDNCMGHTDTDHEYHYHLAPTCLFKNLGIPTPSNKTWWMEKNEAQAAFWPQTGSASPVVGFAIDGFPIMGPYDASGALTMSETLDECNGRTVGGEYQYVMTANYPYLPTCFKGVVGSLTQSKIVPQTACPKTGVANMYHMEVGYEIPAPVCKPGVSQASIDAMMVEGGEAAAFDDDASAATLPSASLAAASVLVAAALLA